MIPGMNPKQMKQMQRQMKKMGMDMKELKNVKEVIIRLEDKELIIPNAEVSLMNVMGQETYQVTGKAQEVEIEEELIIPDEDIEMVANQAGVSKDEAEQALIDTNGDLAEAILKLNQ
ncbi:nascent polypeptide-associated complex protein [Methanobrevibacter woesei]|jgi:nascent polypeptide-associated complex subunit alpha|uniref:Nascent polypeptide-associated complex protein n=2 Tax=Methanobrevibacter woesei TaxID=190976 RepID=A0A2U1S8S5_9EURY|nr:nascent polypeptide-associated complex protein [Methanobrevibacter woesei]PWB86606.1 nascent polypeptide-associated complex protein [Methanobrevibacter woesei]